MIVNNQMDQMELCNSESVQMEPNGGPQASNGQFGGPRHLIVLEPLQYITPSPPEVVKLSKE